MMPRWIWRNARPSGIDALVLVAVLSAGAFLIYLLVREDVRISVPELSGPKKTHTRSLRP